MPDGPVPTSVSDRDETPSERADRNFGELVQELRVAQTGVQILFAFLLTLAFYASFPKDDPGYAYPLAGALLAAAGSAVCFMAPVAFHRLTFRRGGKDYLVWASHRFAVAGLALLALAMLLAVGIVVSFLFDAAAATVAVLGLLLLTLVAWVVLPLRVRARVEQATKPGA